MYLSKLSILNFRSIREMDINLQDGLNVLVGRNNTGKSSILDAIRLAIGPSEARSEALWLDEDDFYKESSSTDRSEFLSVTMEFKGLSQTQRTTFFEIVDFDLANEENSRAILKFEASWPKNKRHASIKRTGGPEAPEMPEIPHRILENIPITYLPALRDAEAALAPGYKSRLATLLRDMSKKSDEAASTRFEGLFKTANDAVSADALVQKVTTSIRTITGEIAGSDAKASSIKTTEQDFLKILRTLQVQMDDTPVSSLSANGLGLNNLLYIAVVLQHLQAIADEECPILLVEEPEAHLHPQLTLTLSEYLSKTLPANKAPQTLITTHSPTLVTSVPLDRIHALFKSLAGVTCNSLSSASLEPKESRMFQRMMDITRSVLYFAKGAILVEGVSESLLIPVFAKRLGYNLTKLQISVIPICGVAFEVFQKILKPDALGIPATIISDADPSVTKGTTWESDTFDASKTPSDRTKKLLQVFSGNPIVNVFHSEVTLEYDLGKAGSNNANIMAQAWESGFVGTPQTFNTSKLTNCTTPEEKAMALWRGVCRADHCGSKADLAHQLSDLLAERNQDGTWKYDFEVPAYIKDALRYVTDAVSASHA